MATPTSRMYGSGIFLLPVLLWIAWRHRRRRLDPTAVLATDAESRVVGRPFSTWLLLSMIGVLLFEPNAPLFLRKLPHLIGTR